MATSAVTPSYSAEAVGVKRRLVPGKMLPLAGFEPAPYPNLIGRTCLHSGRAIHMHLRGSHVEIQSWQRRLESDQLPRVQSPVRYRYATPPQSCATLWQFAHRMSHFAISASRLSFEQLPVFSARVTENRLVAGSLWWKSRHTARASPQTMQDFPSRYSRCFPLLRSRFCFVRTRCLARSCSKLA